MERGIKGSDNKHIKRKTKEKNLYKKRKVDFKMTKKLNHELNVKNDRFDKAMADFEEKMKSTKQTFIVDKDFVKVKKDTFDSMNNVINESKKVMELQPKLQTIFNEVDSYANSYKYLEKENQKYKKEINKLEIENKELRQENNSLIYRLQYLFDMAKKFLRKLLQRGNDYTKDETANVVKDCYDNEEFDMSDVVKISRGTTKQDELFDYVYAPDYYKERVKDNDEYDYDKDDFDLGR